MHLSAEAWMGPMPSLIGSMLQRQVTDRSGRANWALTDSASVLPDVPSIAGSTVSTGNYWVDRPNLSTSITNWTFELKVGVLPSAKRRAS